jgi:hypothetical protein
MWAEEQLNENIVSVNSSFDTAGHRVEQKPVL